MAGHAHAWILPLLEASVAVLFAEAGLLLGGAMLRDGVLVHSRAERSFGLLWPRLALLQCALFAMVETLEGAPVTLLGIAAQIAVALAAAALLVLFARLLTRCARAALAASRYLQRLRARAEGFAVRADFSPSFALATCAGSARFQRPPPSP